MKKVVLAKILAFVVVFSLSGCDSADLTKAPVLKQSQYAYFIHSQDDETVIKDIKAFGRNGECRVVFDTTFLGYLYDKEKSKEYLKANGLKIIDNLYGSYVKCRKKDGSIEEMAIGSVLVLKDGTCVDGGDYGRLTVKEYNEFIPKLSETTWQYRNLIGLPLGKQLVYNKFFDFSLQNCEPKNGKYEIEVKTNFGTFEYEIAGR